MNCYRTLRYCKLNSLNIFTNYVNRNVYSTLCYKQNIYDLQQKILNSFNIQSHFITTRSASVTSSEDGYFKSFMKKVGWLDVSRGKLKFGGYLLYEGIVDQLDYEKWIEENKLSNTFMSWFVITELHVWMLLVRCMAFGEEGRVLRNSIIEALWSDVSMRTKKIGPSSSSLIRNQVNTLSEEFQAALLAYDEGILSNDMVLAGAIWRRFFTSSTDDPFLVENLVKYIRKQTILLETIPRDEFLGRPKITWIPFKKN